LQLRALLTDALNADDLLDDDDDDDDEDELNHRNASDLSQDYSNGGDDNGRFVDIVYCTVVN